MTTFVERGLVGHSNFKRNNPKSDKFEILRFHHVEFYCNDATNPTKRFQYGLGMNLVAKSDMTTGNKKYVSYAVQSNEINIIFTAPYGPQIDTTGSVEPHPGFDKEEHSKFIVSHGMAVRAIGVRVADATQAYNISTANGGIGVLPPKTLKCRYTNTECVIAEVKTVGDVVLRYMSGDYKGAALPNYEPIPVKNNGSCGLVRIDHIVTNVPKLFETLDYMIGFTGFHEFSEFTAEDVGTVDSGLNSLVLANNNEYVLLPFNEPTFGTRRKSQIQTYLEHNSGPGVQHIAIKTDNIFHTMRELKKRGECGGFDFMPAPSHDYYMRIPDRIGKDVLTAEQLKDLEELGLLADKDDQGVLLQVFTQPVGDRPTIFFEIIERVGCDKDAHGHKVEQTAGCGGFGKGNFGELFKSIENFERKFDVVVEK